MSSITIYLDQNKWVELARAQKTGSPTKTLDLLNLINEKVSKGDWVFPLSWSHVFETAKIANPERRQYLSSLMKNISKGLRIAPYTEIHEVEVKNAFYAVKKDLKAIPRPKVVDKWARIDGLPPDMELPFDISDFSIIVEMIFNSSYDKLNNGAEMASFFLVHRNWLQSFSKYQQKDVFLYNYFARKFKQYEDYYKELKITNKDVDDYFESVSLSKDEFMAYIKQMPALYCESAFIYDMMRNPNMPVEEHDSNDIAALCAAIPYCDVVIAEKKWSNVAKYTLHLDSEFNTQLDTSLDLLAKL